MVEVVVAVVVVVVNAAYFLRGQKKNILKLLHFISNIQSIFFRCPLTILSHSFYVGYTRKKIVIFKCNNLQTTTFFHTNCYGPVDEDDVWCLLFQTWSSLWPRKKKNEKKQNKKKAFTRCFGQLVTATLELRWPECYLFFLIFFSFWLLSKTETMIKNTRTMGKFKIKNFFQKKSNQIKSMRIYWREKKSFFLFIFSFSQIVMVIN